MERNVKIDDTLNERVSDAIEEVKELINETWTEEERKLLDSNEIINKLDYDGRIHEIIDGSVPIYTKEIDDAWYLHKQALVDAYENQGLGNNPMEKDGMIAIFCYIEQRVYEWLIQEYD